MKALKSLYRRMVEAEKDWEELDRQFLREAAERDVYLASFYSQLGRFRRRAEEAKLVYLKWGEASSGWVCVALGFVLGLLAREAYRMISVYWL